jgi:hypothetical protein
MRHAPKEDARSRVTRLMNDWTRLQGWWGLASVLACGCAGGLDAQSAQSAPAPRVQAPAPRVQAPEPVAQGAVASGNANAPLEYHEQSDSDRVFIENAERAIGEYTEFIARAGDSPEYARAVQRSREQIQDLTDTLIFVRGGAGARTGAK